MGCQVWAFLRSLIFKPISHTISQQGTSSGCVGRGCAIIATGCENRALHYITEQNRTLLQAQVVRTANANVRRINQPPMEAAAEVFRNSNPKAKLSQSSDAGRLPSFTKDTLKSTH